MSRASSSVRKFAGRVYNAAAEDNVFFLASGVTFSILLAAIPFLLLLVSLPTQIVAGQDIERFQTEALETLWRILPIAAPDVRAGLERELRTIVGSAGSIGVVSAVLFVWLSTRLFGSLRSALSTVFDIEDDHGIIRGKMIDVQLVLVSTLLLVINIAATIYLEVHGTEWLDNIGVPIGALPRFTAAATGFLTVFVMFLLIYKYVPARGLKWRTAGVAATFAALAFELLKHAFSWYIVNYGNYTSIFFAFATVVILTLGVYYASVLFMIGGEVAQAYEVHRVVQTQRETFD